MAQPARAAARSFTQPVRQILTMLLVLVLVGIGAWLALPSVAPVFLANPYLNGFIGFVFVIGVLACFWQVWQIGAGGALDRRVHPAAAAAARPAR